MIASLEGWPTKAKEAPSPHEVRLTPLDTNPVFQCLRETFLAPFYGWGSTASRVQPLQGDSLLFTAKFSEIPGTHFINLRRMKG